MYIHVCPAYTDQTSAGGSSVCVAMDINMGELLVIYEWSLHAVSDSQERRHKKTQTGELAQVSYINYGAHLYMCGCLYMIYNAEGSQV